MWKTSLPFSFKNDHKIYGSPMLDQVGRAGRDGGTRHVGRTCPLNLPGALPPGVSQGCNWVRRCGPPAAPPLKIAARHPHVSQLTSLRRCLLDPCAPCTRRCTSRGLAPPTWTPSLPSSPTSRRRPPRTRRRGAGRAQAGPGRGEAVALGMWDDRAGGEGARKPTCDRTALGSWSVLYTLGQGACMRMAACHVPRWVTPCVIAHIAR